ncbi:hypothetical protein Sste5346_005556 [Sporothrix stenoceras]|uniref:Spermatogenesis-associated protein 20-like TRX domain-containing protein n=1 Tax=Sporothrix stenoceras TaxID=5173 RepID=A0ABR3Z3Q8_9PEZI
MAAQLQKASGASSGSSSEATSLGAAATTPPAPPPAPAPVAETIPLTNRAGESNSPYVRAQADTPVHWQLFGKEALDRAKQENKPIFLHIGFLACHYCHLTTQDSFSNPAIASILNESFIPIVVDREERPDIDAVYWNYLQLVNSSAGWPINVFLTPDLEPVFGGSYWPGPGAEASGRDKQSGSEDGEEDELIGFLGVLEKLRQSWTEREAQCRAEAKETVVQLRKFAAEGTLGPRGLLKPGDAKDSSEAYLPSELDLDIDQLDDAYTKLKKTFDPVNGGFGVVPKFVTPAKYSFLLQLGSFPSVVHDIVGEAEVASIVQMALYTLRKLRNSALNDHLSGGFGRASHTINWTLPHFEKLIPDNGLLLSLYLDAWLYTLRAPKSELPSGSAAGTTPEFLDVVYSLADYLSSAPVRLEGGGFASSESADSYYRKGDRHVREGAYYVWTRREFDTVVGGPGNNGHNDMDARVAAAYWNVLQDGNVDRDNDPFDEFINQNALYINKDTAELARQFNIPRENVERITAEARQKLAAHREKERVRPVLDDKVVVAGNGIVLGSLARVGAALKFGGHNTERGDKYIGAARDAAQFLRENLWDSKDKKLYRVFVNGKREDVLAFAEDYAYLIEGLLELYLATGESEWLEWADELQKQQIDLFYDRPDVPSTQTHSSSGGFYRTQESAGKDGVDLLRLKDGMDTTLPATNAVAASNLFRLGSVLDDANYTHLARETIHAFEVEMLQHSWLFPGLLSQIVSARLGGPQVATLASGPLASDAVVAEYFQRPRAGLRSLVYVEGGATNNGKETTASSWLLARNPSLVDLPTKEAGEGSYVLKDGKWEKATPADLTVNVEASG